MTRPSAIRQAVFVPFGADSRFFRFQDCERYVLDWNADGEINIIDCVDMLNLILGKG